MGVRFPPRGGVSTISRILLVLFVVLVLGGAMFLVTWEIPPPTAHIERVIPDDQLPR
jgi:Na+/H+ antiporter NhaC